MSTTRPLSSATDACRPWPMTYGMVIVGVVAEGTLREGLKLLIKKKWPLLGSRIGKTEKGQWVYRTPIDFDDENKLPFTYSRVQHSTPLAHHLDVPSPTSAPSIHLLAPHTIFDPPPNLICYFLEEYEAKQQPLLHLQVSHFSDSRTCIGLTVSHAFCDAGGLKEILRAWNLAINGRMEAVPELNQNTLFMEQLSAGRDGDISRSQSMWLNRKHKLLPEPLDDYERRWVFVPHAFLRQLKENVVQELQETQVDDPRVSTNDVLSAWWAKTVYDSATAGVDLTRELGLTFYMDMRGRFPSDFGDGVYLHNAVHTATLLLPSISQISKLSVAQLALLYRQTIQREDAEAMLDDMAVFRWLARQQDITDMEIACCPEGAESFRISNVLAMDFGGEWFKPPVQAGSGTGRTLWCDIKVHVRGMDRSTMGQPIRTVPEGIWMLFNARKDWWGNGQLKDMSR